MIARRNALLDQIREEVTRRRAELTLLAQQPPAAEKQANGTAASSPVEPLDLQPTGPAPQRLRLRHLLKFYDRRFVEFAYRCILKRPMDAGGEWYVQRLRRGKSRIGELIHIRYGREGKARRTRVRGLKFQRAVFRLCRIPVLGHLVRGLGYVGRWFWLLATLPHQQAKHEAWKHYVMSLFTQTEDHVNQGHKRLAALSEETQQKLAEIEEAGAEGARRLDALWSQFGNQPGRGNSENFVQRLESLSRRLDAAETAKADIDALARRAAGIECLQRDVERLATQLEELERNPGEDEAVSRRLDELESARDQLAEVAHRLDALQPVEARLHGVSQRLERFLPIKVELDVLARRVERLETPKVNHDEFYARLEDRFRGPEEEIRKRQEFYVPFVEAAAAGTAEAPVLDVGCGRGEWLSVLRSHGKTAQGIDTNEVFLERCRQKELDVAKAEVVEHLESAASRSLGAITGFHIVEHLRADEQIRLVQLAYRALRPGGLLILETPNPEHLSVAALRFYLDPTHMRPLPPPLLEFVLTQAGFENVRIERRAPSGDGEAAQGWSCFQDYAVIGTRPQDEPQ